MKLLLLLILGGAVAAAAIYAVAYRQVSYRYRITVEVETPVGLRAGSAVQEIDARPVLLKLADGDAATIKLRGEAVAVELGERTLFVLLSSEKPGEETILAAVQSAFDPTYRRGGKENLSTVRRMAKVAPGAAVTRLAATNSFESGSSNFYPIMLTFRNPADPSTAEQADPRSLSDTLGKGVRLRQIRVEITDAPVTTGIVARLPWLAEKPPSLDRSWQASIHPTFVQLRSYSDFKRE